MEKGIESLKHDVMIETERGENCFNENGCDHEFSRIEPETSPALIKMGFTTCCRRISKCEHKYCDKYKWIIDRSKHYAKRTGKSYEDIIAVWEKSRDNNWFMNFYQECNMPLNGRKYDSAELQLIKRNIPSIRHDIDKYEELIIQLNEDADSRIINTLKQKRNELQAILNTMLNYIENYEINQFID